MRRNGSNAIERGARALFRYGCGTVWRTPTRRTGCARARAGPTDQRPRASDTHRGAATCSRGRTFRVRPRPSRRRKNQRRRSHSSSGMVASGGIENASDGAGDVAVLFQLAGELMATGLREVVIARAAVLAGPAPLADNPALHEHPLESGVEGTFLDVQHVCRGAANGFGDLESVHVLVAGEGVQDEHVEGALRY